MIHNDMITWYHHDTIMIPYYMILLQYIFFVWCSDDVILFLMILIFMYLFFLKLTKHPTTQSWLDGWGLKKNLVWQPVRWLRGQKALWIGRCWSDRHRRPVERATVDAPQFLFFKENLTKAYHLSGPPRGVEKRFDLWIMWIVNDKTPFFSPWKNPGTRRAILWETYPVVLGL